VTGLTPDDTYRLVPQPERTNLLGLDLFGRTVNVTSATLTRKGTTVTRSTGQRHYLSRTFGPQGKGSLTACRGGCGGLSSAAHTLASKVDAVWIQLTHT